MTDFQYTKAETILKVENISINLDGNQILKDVNFEIKDIQRPGICQGQIVSIVGPSGVGKSTLFNIIAGFLKPDTGSVLLLEKELHEVKIGQIGVLQQGYPLFDFMTVEQNMNVAAQVLPKSERKDRINSLIDSFSLQDKMKLYPRQLSGGQRQRVGICQQMVCGKNVLLCDELYSGLDSINIQKANEMIVKAANASELGTILIISHDIRSCAAISHEVLLVGRERDVNGKIIPGAKIIKTYDMIEENLAWHPDIHMLPHFAEVTAQIREDFKYL